MCSPFFKFHLASQRLLSTNYSAVLTVDAGNIETSVQANADRSESATLWLQIRFGVHGPRSPAAMSCLCVRVGFVAQLTDREHCTAKLNTTSFCTNFFASLSLRDRIKANVAYSVTLPLHCVPTLSLSPDQPEESHATRTQMNCEYLREGERKKKKNGQSER